MITGSVTRSIPDHWQRLLDNHAAALQEYRAAATVLNGGSWMAPLAPGKWSPAEITAHVSEAYRVLASELAGASGMALRGSKLQRLVLRHTMLPRLLSGKPFPSGVRAPRETRPTDVIVDSVLALTTLGRLAEQFTRNLTEKCGDRHVRLTHAYFGPMTARQALQLCIMHTRHHARQLAAISRAPVHS